MKELKETNEKVKLNIVDEVATLTLNRPEKRNAFDDETIALLLQHLNFLQSKENIRVLILRGAGPDFCAGADIDWMRKQARFLPQENLKDAEQLAELMYTLDHYPIPTITVVQGAVYGGGLGLVACSDICLSHPSTQFCFSELKLGLIPAVVGPYVFKAIGKHACRRYMLSAEAFDAEQALRLGLIDEILEPAVIDKRLATLIKAFSLTAPQALKQAKAFIHILSEEPLSGTTLKQYTSHLISEMRATEEGQEGLSAFLEKRKPNWVKK